MEIIPFQETHLEDAAQLASRRYRALRDTVPIMPSRYGDPDTLLPMLRNLAGHAPGVVALRAGRMVGFISSYLLPDWRGQRATYSPEWGNGAEASDSRQIYESLYAHLAARWVQEGYRTHLVSMLAHDRDALQGWNWLGFGLTGVDAVQSLDPIPGPRLGLEIRRAHGTDAERTYSLLMALHTELSESPTFLPSQARSRAEHLDWLADPANALWVAFRGKEPIACMGQGPSNPNACTIIADDGTTSIVSAFTVEEARNLGTATVLLNEVLGWGRTQGYERCAVDFEPMNLLGRAFWLKTFQPVCYALRRDLDPVAASAQSP